MPIADSMERIALHCIALCLWCDACLQFTFLLNFYFFSVWFYFLNFSRSIFRVLRLFSVFTLSIWRMCVSRLFACLTLSSMSAIETPPVFSTKNAIYWNASNRTIHYDLHHRHQHRHRRFFISYPSKCTQRVRSMNLLWGFSLFFFLIYPSLYSYK